MKGTKSFLFGVSAMLVALVLVPLPALASNSWGGYHWARTANPFNLSFGDNVTTAWDNYLSASSSDWSRSTVLDTTIVAGNTKPRNCRATQGRVEVCDAKYGNNGWLGMAQIWVGGSHIYQGIVKVNDTYFSNGTYNTPAWRNMVMCQETGHTFGLDHQDTNFNNAPLGSCMDYSADPTPNQHPNQHDYDQLSAIYAHLDSTNTASQSLPAGPGKSSDAPRSWGKLVRKQGKTAIYELDLGKGQKIFTFVVLI